MSLLIKGLKMPRGEGMLCINIYPDGKVCINHDLKCKRIATAAPVPPHGRLIDADKIDYYKIERNGMELYMVWKGQILNMPTIIEGDESET